MFVGVVSSILALVFVLFPSRSSATDYEGAWSQFCGRHGYHDSEAARELRTEAILNFAALCQCADRHPSLEASCESSALADQWFSHWESHLKLGLKSYTQTGISKGCTEAALWERLSAFALWALDTCKHRPALPEKWLTPPSPAGEDCWHLTGMNDQKCLVAESCDPRGSSSLQALPLRQPTSQERKKQTFLCSPALTKAYQLKDPHSTNLHGLDPFLNYLAHGQIAKSGDYAMANCHGTAQALAGNILGHWIAENKVDWSGANDPECKKLMDAQWTAGGSHSYAELNPSQGMAINMLHASCSKDQCGKISWVSRGCSVGKLDSYFFVDKMCVDCWSEQIKMAGYRELAPTEGTEFLVPGCVLTQADHSVTVLLNNNGLCSYFEATTPAGPPQLRVSSCAEMWVHFPRRWCPIQKWRYQLG